MLSFAWRWAQVGDAVLVHGDGGRERSLTPGAVRFVRRRGRETKLGIEVVEDGEATVLWPFRADIHPDPLDPAERCIRCDETQPGSVAGRTPAR